MRTIATLTAAAAVVAAFGFASAAMAQDPEADAVAVDGINNASCGGDCNGAATDALEAVNGTLATLGAQGFVKLNFTDNFCIIAAGDDVTVTEVGTPEAYDVQVATSGGALSTVVGGGPGTDSVDLGAGVTTFNQIQITDVNGVGTTVFIGADIDAVECLSSFDTDDIVKVFAVHGDDGGVFDQIDQTSKDNDIGPQFKAFEITITNETGLAGGLAGLTFLDTVPAEFDLDPIEELDNAVDRGGTVDDDLCEDPLNAASFISCSAANVVNNAKGSTFCDDGDCDGIEVSSEPTSGDCTASGDEGGAKGKGKGNQKLAPEVLTMTAAGLDDPGTGESCTIKVWVMTDDDHPGRGRNPDFTPTSCPVTLNDGVQVFDGSFNLLLQDDDSLVFDDNDPVSEGVCNPA